MTRHRHGAAATAHPPRRCQPLDGHRPATAYGATDHGAAAVMLLLLTPALFALAGLVLDGGTQLAARQHAADLAEQAARAGADQLDTGTLRATGAVTVDAVAAGAAACRYARTAEPTATCTATVQPGAAGTQVQVRIGTRTPTVLLGLIGINALHVQAVATAQALTGIRTAALSQPLPPHLAQHRTRTAAPNHATTSREAT